MQQRRWLLVLVSVFVALASAAACVGGPFPPRRNCAARPSGCGFPDATNTGVPTGTRLRAVPGEVRSGRGWHYDPRGWVVIDGAGAVFDAFRVSVGVVVVASNVTISRSEITTNGQDSHGVTVGQVGRPVTHTTIRDSFIHGRASGHTPNHMYVGVMVMYVATDTTVLRSEIANIGVGLQYAGNSDGLVQDNYIHAFGWWAYPPSNDADHNTGTSSAQGSAGGYTVRHNTIFNQNTNTSAVALYHDEGTQFNATIDNNLLAGGGYCIYGGDSGAAPSGPTHDIRITNNRISPRFFPAGGQWGWLAAFTAGHRGNVLRGNVWDHNNQPLR